MLTRDVIAISATNALITLGGLFSGIVVARMLGPDGRGDWAAILLWPGIIGYIGTLGTDVVIGRRVAQDEKTVQRHAVLSIVLTLFFSTVLLIPALLILPLLLSSEKQYLLENGRLALMAIPAIILNSYLGAIALGARNILVYNVGRLALTISYVTFLSIAWTTLGSSLNGVTIAYLGSVLCGTFLAYLLLPRAQDRPERISLSEAWDIARTGVVFAPGYVIYALTNNVSILWLAALADSMTLGLYVVALAFSSIQQVVSQALAKTAFVNTLRSQNEADAAEIIALQIRRSLVALGFLAVLLIVMAPWILPWIFGPAFSTATGLVNYLAPGFAFFAFGQIIEEILKAKGVAAASILARILSGTVVSVCAVALIPRIGADGMALSYLVGGIAECSVFMAYLRRHIRLTVADLVVPKIMDWDTRARRNPLR